MNDADYYSYLYEIASCLNREFSVQAALRKALEKSVKLLGLETGWIWMMQENGSVYLAASYNLPPALRDNPELLSGRCYCLEKYLSDKMENAANISEIACSRLKDLQSGTRELKFHASVPIRVHTEKVGIINLLSKEHQELNRAKLCVLNTIGELIGIAVHRTRVQDSQELTLGFDHSVKEILGRVFKPKLQDLVNSIETVKGHINKKDQAAALNELNASAQLAWQIKEHVSHILVEFNDHPAQSQLNGQFNYPVSTLTSRELELLTLVRKGYTNRQIAETVFISERTVKFHISSILQKLAASTRTEAVDIALKRGLISL